MVLPQRRHPDGQADALLWQRRIHPERLLGAVHPRLEVSIYFNAVHKWIGL